MKFLLIMHMNPLIWNALTEEEQRALGEGHDGFIERARESGELLGGVGLEDPAASVVVRAPGGVPVVSDGPYLEAKEYFGGYYLVECAGPERAYELAAMIPDARVEGLGVEVRPVVFATGAEAGAGTAETSGAAAGAAPGVTIGAPSGAATGAGAADGGADAAPAG